MCSWSRARQNQRGIVSQRKRPRTAVKSFPWENVSDQREDLSVNDASCLLATEPVSRRILIANRFGRPRVFHSRRTISASFTCLVTFGIGSNLIQIKDTSAIQRFMLFCVVCLWFMPCFINGYSFPSQLLAWETGLLWKVRQSCPDLIRCEGITTWQKKFRQVFPKSKQLLKHAP